MLLFLSHPPFPHCVALFLLFAALCQVVEALNLFALVFVRPPSARVEAFSFRVVSRLQPSPRPGGLRTGFLTKPRLHFSSVPRGPLYRVSLESDLDTRPYLLLREGRHRGVCPACSASSTKNLFSLRVRICSVEYDQDSEPPA